MPIKAVPGNRFSLNLSMIRIDKNEMWRMDPASVRSRLCSLSSSRFDSLFFSWISFYNNKHARSLRSRWIVKARIMKRILNSCCTHVSRASPCFISFKCLTFVFAAATFSESLESNREIKIYQNKHIFSLSLRITGNQIPSQHNVFNIITCSSDLHRARLNEPDEK